MLSQYKNIDQIQFATKSTSGLRFTDIETQLFSYFESNQFPIVPEILNNLEDTRLEFHVYSSDIWITGNHKIQHTSKLPQFVDATTNKSIPITNGIGIDLKQQLDTLQVAYGSYTIVVNFFKNLIGSYEQQTICIDEISPDRTEIRFRAIDSSNPKFLQEITSFIDTVKQTSTNKNSKYTSYLLNFSRNQTIQFVNSVVIGEYIYVKLKEQLPSEFDINFKCWIVEELKNPYIDKINIVSDNVIQPPKVLSGPNWQASYAYNTSNDTGLKTWNDLLGTSTQTSQQLVDSYFSGSLSATKLNINYADFNNFIFYSSATERLANFKYKLELLEYYTSQSAAVALISGSVAITNAQDFLNLQTNLIGGFDGFEQYLYYQSSSMLTTYDLPRESSNVIEITGSYVTPVPKTNATTPYTLAAINSTNFSSWYNNLYATASLYDSLNSNALIYAIPEYIRFDDNNEQLSTFVNMLGHHYDILYMYINHMSLINKRVENPKLGMPNELLYSVAKQFGWNLTDGNQSQDLWKYVLGTSEAGIPLTGSNTVGDPSVPGRDMTYTIWRRIVNNLPLLLKSKGTKRSVQALLSCYGIPQSFISINEYGGPRLDRAPLYKKLNFDYALDLSGSSAGTVTVNYSQSINTVELRFRTMDVIKYPTMPSTMNLFTVGSNVVTLDYTSGTKGTMKINGTGSGNIELFDGGWLTTMLRTNGTNLDLITKKSKYGKIIAAVSASATASFATSASLTLGSTSVGASRLFGQLQELRFWSSSLLDSAFNNHVSAPAAYNGNIDAYDELVFRLPLTQKINHTLTSSLGGYQPKTSSISASFTGWTLSTPYDSIEETYYYDSISLGAGTFDDNKIRLEDNELVGTLDVKTRAERSQFDKAPLDSKKIGVYFSPQTMIDEDIIAQLGFTELDQYIGDPGSVDLNSYPRLVQAAQSYWKKYSNKNDINTYINMFTLFDLSFFKQLDQLLPARTNKLTGILIQPNILERSKDTVLPKVQRFDNSYTCIIDNISPTASAAYSTYLGEIDGKILQISAADDDQLQGYLTASTHQKYDGTTYSYDYLIYSGSTYITASTPYWMSEGELPVYLTGVYSTIKLLASDTRYITGSAVKTRWTGSRVDVQDYLPTGVNNQRYAGSKLTSPAFNINSTQTVDGGPVVEWRSANPNQLIYQNNGEQGSFVLV
jgi:hypothetical protein